MPAADGKEVPTAHLGRTAPSAQLRYAVVGTGDRAQAYVDALLGAHADVGRIVAWCEPNPARMDFYDDVCRAAGAAVPERYGPDVLERMIDRERVDRVIVTSPDHTHADLVVRALDAGADVLAEDPLATDLAGCRRVVEAVERTGRSLLLPADQRYSPANAALKQVLASGRIGEVTSVHVEWLLDTLDGADHFRGWHRRKDASGGLLVHQASGHFDLVNWWLADLPSRVYASGALRFYGASNARHRGMTRRPDRGTGRSARNDPFMLDLRDDPRLERLYLAAEEHDGYLRDRDVFSAGITIEDNLAVIVDYARGATLAYSLNAHSPWAGYRVAVNGTAGRAELDVVQRGWVPSGVGGAADAGQEAGLDGGRKAGHEAGRDGAEQVRRSGARLVVQEHWAAPAEVPIDTSGEHGERRMLRDVLRRGVPDLLGRPAGLLDAVRAVVVGLAGNTSLETGLPVRTADLRLGGL